MYIPPPFREDRPEVLHDFMRRHGFASLVTRDDDGRMTASRLPFVLDAARGRHGTLRTHLAAANPQWRELSAEREVMVLFQGPHAYVSPRWYGPAAASASVPTWNYTAVHAYGRPRVLRDEADVRAVLAETVRAYEGAPGDDAAAWSVDRLPEVLVAHLARAVVAVEIELTRVEGKFKLSQNRTPADRAGVAAALSRSADSSARAVAALMREGAAASG